MLSNRTSHTDITDVAQRSCVGRRLLRYAAGAILGRRRRSYADSRMRIKHLPNPLAGAPLLLLPAYEAALAFNEGNTAKYKVLEVLKIVPGKYFESAMENFDILRVGYSEKKAKLGTLEVRRARRKLRIEKEKKTRKEKVLDMLLVRYAKLKF
ncbi:hypothetical protein J6590_048259 [Homalodisca vitripennis]|nr:hypothetical protein J6590_048259 [Homalodisca vitripennis]